MLDGICENDGHLLMGLGRRVIVAANVVVGRVLRGEVDKIRLEPELRDDLLERGDLLRSLRLL